MFKPWIEILHDHDKGYLDWLFNQNVFPLKLQLHDTIYRLRFYSNSLIHILPLSTSHNKVASLQKNREDKSHHVIVALESQLP